MLAGVMNCTVVETDAGTDQLWDPQVRGFRELLPWADPYIAQLLLKHQMLSRWEAEETSWETAAD